jgi:hypothetical protein
LRKIITIQFLLVFFTGNAGYYIFYAWQQHEIKEAVERQLLAEIPDSSLVQVVAYENASFSWEQEGREFYQDGKMYDVAKCAVINGRQVLYCIADEKEAALLLQWGKTTGQENGKGTTQHIKIQVIDLLVQPLAPASPQLIITRQYPVYITTPVSSAKEVIAPPPRA